MITRRDFLGTTAIAGAATLAARWQPARAQEPASASANGERQRILVVVQLSGGEPTMRPERLLRLVRALRTLPFRVRLDLYTNGDRLSDDLLRELKDAGLDALRFNLVARDFDTEPVERALRVFDETAVEVPVVPERLAEMKAAGLLSMDLPADFAVPTPGLVEPDEDPIEDDAAAPEFHTDFLGEATEEGA